MLQDDFNQVVGIHGQEMTLKKITEEEDFYGGGGTSVQKSTFTGVMSSRNDLMEHLSLGDLEVGDTRIYAKPSINVSKSDVISLQEPLPDSFPVEWTDYEVKRIRNYQFMNQDIYQVFEVNKI